MKQTSVVEIMQNMTLAIDISETGPTMLFELINNKIMDTGFLDLVDSILESGIETPIEWDGNTLGNGHHRFVAAILLCLDTIPTTGGRNSDGNGVSAWYGNDQNLLPEDLWS